MKDKRITISKKQMRELGGMSGSALEEIYNFASEGDEEQAAGLAEAFRYVPMFISNSSYLEDELESFRMELEHLKKKYVIKGFCGSYVDYLADLDSIFSK